jgi:hypothetical protein
MAIDSPLPIEQVPAAAGCAQHCRRGLEHLGQRIGWHDEFLGTDEQNESLRADLEILSTMSLLESYRHYKISYHLNPAFFQDNAVPTVLPRSGSADLDDPLEVPAAEYGQWVLAGSPVNDRS